MQDVDIILLYDKNYIRIDSAIKLKKEMLNYWKRLFDIFLDMSLLSIDEEKEIKFIKRQKLKKYHFGSNIISMQVINY